MTTSSLEQYLDSLQREQSYRIDAVLKESPHETTQRVFLMGDDGMERGPYVRKYISRDAGMGAAYERIFEAQRAGLLLEHVPAILECYLRDDSLVVIMELVPGETLQEHVYRNDPSIELAKSVFPRICDAARELHERFDPPIIHRDLKPSNIIVSDDRIAIIDYGIAREFHENAYADTMRFGTRAFAPPEQFGFGQTTVRSDIYALGMLLYFCLTETIPTPGIRESGFDDERIPEPIRAVIVKATAFDPSNRYGSADELKLAFCSACDGHGDATGNRKAGKESFSAGRPDTAASGNSPAHAPIPYSSSASTSADAPSPKPREENAGVSTTERSHRILDRAYNVLLTVFAIGICSVGFVRISSPTEGMLRQPDWFNVLSYGIVVPVFIVFLWFALLDKRRLRRRFPAFERLRGWRAWLVLGAVTLTLLIVIRIARYVAGLS